MARLCPCPSLSACNPARGQRSSRSSATARWSSGPGRARRQVAPCDVPGPRDPTMDARAEPLRAPRRRRVRRGHRPERLRRPHRSAPGDHRRRECRAARCRGPHGHRPASAVGELSYYLAPRARGRGVATRAVSLLADWAEDELDLRRLELHVLAGNEASLRLAERLSFEREGVLRNRGCTAACATTSCSSRASRASRGVRPGRA